jgi:hypothetical protein
MAYVYVDDDEILENIENDELVEILERRGFVVLGKDNTDVGGGILYNDKQLVKKVYWQIRDGKLQATEELRQLMSVLTGKIV